jgi:Protein of unknown function (DUF1153)
LKYALLPEDLAAWDAAFDQNGIRGPRVTRLQDYRNTALYDQGGRENP